MKKISLLFLINIITFIILFSFTILKAPSFFVHARKKPVNDLYALYVEKMVGHAKQAARHFNAGKRKQADENIKLATETYNKAINLLPTRPEAYLNHATFLFNIQRLEESVETWEKALKVATSSNAMGKKEKQGVLENIHQRLKQAKYGLVSKTRDEVYQEGKGNLKDSLKLIHEQIKMYNSPRLRHDEATVTMMLSESGHDDDDGDRNDDSNFATSPSIQSIKTAMNSFRYSQRISLYGAVGFERKLNSIKETTSKKGYRGASAHVNRNSNKKGKRCPRNAKILSFKNIMKNDEKSKNKEENGKSSNNDEILTIYEVFNNMETKWLLSNKSKRIYDKTFTNVAYSNHLSSSENNNNNNDKDGENKYYFGLIASMTNSIISGPDGVITRQDQCRLNVVKTTSWPFVPIHANLWLKETWVSNTSFNIYDHSLTKKYPPPGPNSNRMEIIRKGMTIVDFASHNFYHFLLISIPKLVMMKSFLKHDRDIVLIHPIDRSSNNFITNLISIVLSDIVADGKGNIKFYPYDTRNYMPGGRLIVKSLLFAISNSVEHIVMPATHCLLSSIWLQRTNKLFKSIKLSESANVKIIEQYDIVYVTRQHARSRKFNNKDEKLFYDKLKTVKNSHIVNFNGLKETTQSAISMFSKANVVIGIHGAGLSNVLFCKPGTILIEFGFTNPMSCHFEHIAKSLGIKYLKIPVTNRFQHGMSTTIVTIDETIMDQTIMLLNRLQINNANNNNNNIENDINIEEEFDLLLHNNNNNNNNNNEKRSTTRNQDDL